MIGNDVVDLELSRKESNWQRKGLIDKICSDAEKILIQSSKDQELMFWRLWSTKEAMYKIWNRKTGIRIFNPKFFECFDIKSSEGKVRCGDNIFWSNTKVIKTFIHTIVLEEKADYSKILYQTDREFILKINQLPFFYDKNRNINPNISISTHGRFEKIVILKSKSSF